MRSVSSRSAAARTIAFYFRLSPLSFIDRWFKRRPAPAALPETPAKSDGCDRLASILAAHGVETDRDDGLIVLPQQGAGAVAYLAWSRPDTCELQVRFALADERVIIENFAGIGANAREAEQDAWRNFTLSSFHPLLRGVLIGGSDEQVEVEEWIVGGSPYRVVIGAATQRRPPSGEELPPAWFDALQKAITEAGVGSDLNWVRFFYGQLNRQATVEVLLNNQAWPEVAAAMTALPWPTVEGYYSVRVFLTLSRI
jgi:hypothetical protein